MEKRRFLAVVMTILMVISMIPSVVFAAAPSGELGGKLKIKGLAAVGVTVSADYSKVTPEGVTDEEFTFSWSRQTGEKELTQVGTEKTYTITQDDLGYKLVLDITPVDGNGLTGTLTAKTLEVAATEEEAKAAGVDAFIAKPLFRSRLTATLRQFTSGRKENTARNYLEKLSEADYTGKRILLVEDNELNREIAGEILQMTGAEVETAENGKIAVEKVEASQKGLYDLVFMDIQMPVMNGYEATAAIRSLPGEQGKLPIVAMTANAFAEDVQLAKNTGMNGHIAKPLDMNKLNDVLENWL